MEPAPLVRARLNPTRCTHGRGPPPQLKDALDTAGATSTLTILPGARHADPVFDQTQTEPTIAFLQQTFGM